MEVKAYLKKHGSIFSYAAFGWFPLFLFVDFTATPENVCGQYKGPPPSCLLPPVWLDPVLAVLFVAGTISFFVAISASFIGGLNKLALCSLFLASIIFSLVVIAPLSAGVIIGH